MGVARHAPGACLTDWAGKEALSSVALLKDSTLAGVNRLAASRRSYSMHALGVGLASMTQAVSFGSRPHRPTAPTAARKHRMRALHGCSEKPLPDLS